MRMLRHALFPLLCLALIAGCSGNTVQAPAKVSGQVTYKGAALPAGTIHFHSEDKGIYRSPLAQDGTFEVVDIPKGTMVVTVETESVNPAKKAPDYGGGKGAADYAKRIAAEGIQAKQSTAQYVKIPKKYASAKTSPLTVTVEAGRQTKQFDLTD
jgi:hypothetical protein